MSRAAIPTNAASESVGTARVGLDAQAVEEFRVELHGLGIMRSGACHNKNGPHAID